MEMLYELRGSTPHFKPDFSAGNRSESPSHTLKGMSTDRCLRTKEGGEYMDLNEEITWKWRDLYNEKIDYL
jgi:hypothetical protein